MFKKRPVTPLDKRLKQIEDQLSNINKDMRTLAKPRKAPEPVEPAPPRPTVRVPPEAEAPRRPVVQSEPAEPVVQLRRERATEEKAPEPAPEVAPRQEKPPRRETDKIYDGKFADYYMASSMNVAPSLRRERNRDRNRALIMMIVLVLLFILLIYRFF